MKQNDDNATVLLAKLLCVLALIVAQMPMVGFTIKTLWGWFLTPIGLAPLHLWHAAGVGLFISYTTFHASAANKDVSFWERAFIALVFSPALFLGLGFLAHALM